MSGPNTLLEINRGEPLAATLTYTFPTGDLTAATEITFKVKRNLDDLAAAALITATKTGGQITVTDATHAALLTPAVTIPAGRYQWAAWITLSTGEAYETDGGILNVLQTAGSPD